MFHMGEMINNTKPCLDSFQHTKQKSHGNDYLNINMAIEEMRRAD